jgi:hypothetical protein
MRARLLAKRLVNRVVRDEDVEREGYATAERIAAEAPLVARWHKQFVERLTPRVALAPEEWAKASRASTPRTTAKASRLSSRNASRSSKADESQQKQDHAYLTRLPPGKLLAVCLVLAAIIGVIDYESGVEMNIAMLYLAPIFMTAWALGTQPAIVMSIIRTTAWFISVLYMHQTYSQPWLHVWDGTIQFAMFVVFGIVISKLKIALGHADERFATVLEGLDAACTCPTPRPAKSSTRTISFARRFRRQLGSVGSARRNQREFHDAAAAVVPRAVAAVALDRRPHGAAAARERHQRAPAHRGAVSASSRRRCR